MQFSIFYLVQISLVLSLAIAFLPTNFNNRINVIKPSAVQSTFSSKFSKIYSQKNDRVVNKITRESEDEYFTSEVI